jgi:pyruvate/2-oxoglutarate/acetoin dehydrogenase E1 component
MTYKESINRAMHYVAKNSKAVFIGYNVKVGKAGGTLEGIDEAQLIETPVAENLMVGMGIGMSLNGYLPVVYFERFDFIMDAMDAIVNHLDKIKTISEGEFDPKIIIRCVVGNTKNPLYTGLTHTQDYSYLFTGMNFPVLKCKTPEGILAAYRTAVEKNTSSLIVEYKDLY